MFDALYKRHVTPRLASFYGGQVVYVEPIDAGNDTTDLEWVIVSDARREVRDKDYGKDIMEVRYFQMITDPDSPRYCGIERPAIGGRLMIGDGEDEDADQWPIVEMPATDSDGFTKVRCERMLRFEIGNPKARG